MNLSNDILTKLNLPLFYNQREPENQELIRYICSDILSNPIEKKEYSNEFAFVYIDGRNNLDLNTLEHHSMFTSCRIFTEKKYPIFCFINNIVGENENCLVAGEYDATLYKIDEINTHDKYSEFCIKELPFLFPKNIENLIFIAPDAFLIKRGIEDFIINNNLDMIGAHWRHNAGIDVFNEKYGWLSINGMIDRCNLAFSFRKLSLMKEISQKYSCLVQKERGTIDKQVPEDLFYSFWGYLSCICKIPNLKECDEFCQDPFTLEMFKNKISFGFHHPKYKSEWAACNHD